MVLLVVVFLAIFTQSLTGFGSALLSMPLLVPLLGLRIAAPLVALVTLISEVVLLIRYRAALNTRLVWRLAIASLLGIPLGVLALAKLDERIMTAALGIVVLAYAAYALFGRRPPQLRWSGWAFGAGFLAGNLGGAYNTSGPPVILCADSQRWPRDEFKGNLQGFFLINSFLVVALTGASKGLEASSNQEYTVFSCFWYFIPPSEVFNTRFRLTNELSGANHSVRWSMG